MQDFMFDLGMSALITTLRSIKGTKKKAQLKKAFLKLHQLILGVYGDDPDFQS